MFTAVYRDLAGEPQLKFMRQQAYGAGVDFSTFFKDRDYRFEASLQGSDIRGSAESILSLQDPALVNCRGSTMLSLLNRLLGQGNPVSGWLCLPLLRLAQRRHESQQAKVRRQLMKQDKHLRRVLAFSGKFE